MLAPVLFQSGDGYIDGCGIRGSGIPDWNPAMRSWRFRIAADAWNNEGIERQMLQREWIGLLNGRHWTLVGFQYGPCPEDWLIWMYDWDQSFTDFWNRVECIIESMPGAWPDK